MRKLVIVLVLLCAVFTVIRAMDTVKHDSFSSTAAISPEFPIPVTK
jgi:hypothetical protein